MFAGSDACRRAHWAAPDFRDQAETRGAPPRMV